VIYLNVNLQVEASTTTTQEQANNFQKLKFPELKFKHFFQTFHHLGLHPLNPIEQCGFFLGFWTLI
jgi:hypothetical protein